MKHRVPVSYFRCTACQHGFRRPMLNLKGMTTCPKCKARISRRKALAAGEERASVLSECSARKLAKNAEIYNPASAPTDTVKGKQVPMSTAEARFKASCVTKGWKPHRPSWPDYLVETPQGFVAIEVKSKTDCVSLTQAATFEMLTEMGVRVYVWQCETGGARLHTWWDYMQAFGLVKAVERLRGKPVKPKQISARTAERDFVAVQASREGERLRAVSVG